MTTATEATRIPLIPGTIWAAVGWSEQIRANITKDWERRRCGMPCADCATLLNGFSAVAHWTSAGPVCSACSRRRALRQT